MGGCGAACRAVPGAVLKAYLQYAVQQDVEWITRMPGSYDKELSLRTAVVIACVASGAVLSFAWYLFASQSESIPSLSFPFGKYSPAERHYI